MKWYHSRYLYIGPWPKEYIMDKLQTLLNFLKLVIDGKQPLTYINSGTEGYILSASTSLYSERNISSKDSILLSLEDMDMVITTRGLKEAIEKWSPLESECHQSTPVDKVWVPLEVIEALGGLDFIKRNAAHLKGELEWHIDEGGW